MQALDFSPIANAPLNAMQAAAYGDALQENRYRNRLLHMADAEDMRKKSVANLIAAGNWDASQPQPAPQAPTNQLAPQPAQQQPAPGASMPTPQQAPGAGIYGQMAQVPGDQQAPTNQLTGDQPPAQAATPPDQFTQQRMKLRDLYNSGQINAADAQQYSEQIGVKETAAKWDNLKMQVESGKLEQAKVDLLMDKLAPLVRASTPAQEEYERVLKATGDQQKAKAAAQPLYQDAVKTIAAMPGMGDAAKNAPKEFNPGLAYALKDTYAAIERRATAGDTQRAKADVAAEKANDRTITQVVTPAGLPVFADKNGGLFVNGKSYNGPVVKEKAGQGTNITVKMPDGTGGTDSFKEYTPQMKEQAFKDRNLGTYKYPTGMKSMAEKQAFDRQYYKWRVDGKISANDVMAERGGQAANKSELVKLQGQRGQVMAFARTFDKNIDLALQLSEKTDRTGNTVLNRWLLAGKKATGDSMVAQFDAANRTAINEYAKLVSSATGGGVTSDSARHEVEDILAKVQTKEQYRDVVNNVLKKDRKNRESGYDDEINRIKEAMRGKTDQPPANPNVADLSRRITSDMRGKWSDIARSKLVYHNLRDKGYSQEDIERAFDQAEGGK